MVPAGLVGYLSADLVGVPAVWTAALVGIGVTLSDGAVVVADESRWDRPTECDDRVLSPIIVDGVNLHTTANGRVAPTVCVSRDGINENAGLEHGKAGAALPRHDQMLITPVDPRRLSSIPRVVRRRSLQSRMKWQV
jgi:hypothetical protein